MYRVETEPGEDDAYGAPTRVGPMSKDLIDKMMREADSGGSGIRAPVKIDEPTAARSDDVAVMYDDYDDGELEPTRLHGQAQAAAVLASRTQVMPAIGLAPPVHVPPPAAPEAPPPLLQQLQQPRQPQQAQPPTPLPVAQMAPRFPTAPRPAAFPEWIAVPMTVDPGKRSRDRELVLAIAAASILGASSIALWLFA